MLTIKGPAAGCVGCAGHTSEYNVSRNDTSLAPCVPTERLPFPPDARGARALFPLLFSP